MKDYEAVIDKLYADERLSHIQRILMLFFYRYANEEGRCQANYRRIEKVTHISLGAISVALAYLEELGYIRHEKPQQSGFAGMVHLEDMPPATSDWQEISPSSMEYRASGVKIIVRVEQDKSN